jgi:hypothetical protein
MSKFDKLIEIKPLADIAVIKETLARCGIANKKKKILYPSCYLYEAFGVYYIAHFKQLFLLTRQDGYNNLCEDDLARRNGIIFCLKNWGLIDVDESIIEPHDKFIFVLPFKEKNEWIISNKFNINNVDNPE